MKLEDYLPYYNMFYQGNIRINGIDYDITTKNFWENWDIEIDEWIVDSLNYYDTLGFSQRTKTIYREKRLINFLQESLEQYVFSTGNETIEWLEYTMGWFLPHTFWFKGWQVVIIEKWLYDKIKVYSEFYVQRGNNKNNDLPSMFNDPEKLDYIYSQLEKHSFIENGKWIGKRNVKTAKLPGNKQLAALTLIFEERGYFNKDYTDKEKHSAICSYFDVQYSNYYFKYGQRIEIEDYKNLFTFI